MRQGIQLAMVVDDPDYVKLRIFVSNGEFAGAADVYESPEAPLELATKLQGFPQSPSDAREIILGSFGSRTAGGAAKMRFFCSDGSGTSWVEAQIESGRAVAGTVQSARTIIPVEAAGIDDFVLELRAVHSRASKVASLPSVDRPDCTSLV